MSAPLGRVHALPSLAAGGSGARDAAPLFGAAPAAPQGPGKSTAAPLEPKPMQSQQMPLPSQPSAMQYGHMPANASSQVGNASNPAEPKPNAPNAMDSAAMRKEPVPTTEPIAGLPMGSHAARSARSTHILQSVHFLQRIPHGVLLSAGNAPNLAGIKPPTKTEPVYPPAESSVHPHASPLFHRNAASMSASLPAALEPAKKLDLNNIGDVMQTNERGPASQAHGNRNSLPRPSEPIPGRQPTSEPSRDVFNQPRLFSMYAENQGPLPRIVSELPRVPDAASRNPSFRTANQPSNAAPAPALLQPLFGAQPPIQSHHQAQGYMPRPAPFTAGASQSFRSAHDSEPTEKSSMVASDRTMPARGPPSNAAAPAPLHDPLGGNKIPVAVDAKPFRANNAAPPQHAIGNSAFPVHQSPSRQAAEMRDVNGSIGGTSIAGDSVVDRSSIADAMEASSTIPVESASIMYPGQGQAVPGQGTDERRGQLKVEHALAYLEQVKTQFGDNIEVYNRFLDIMKAFKAQTIDTTEVIVRVSQLFLGHSTLVLGFNRFLPPGYKIQIVEDEKTGALRTGFEGPQGFSALPSRQNVELDVSPPSHSTSHEHFNDVDTAKGSKELAPSIQVPLDAMHAGNDVEHVKRRLDIDSPTRHREVRPATGANDTPKKSIPIPDEHNSAPDFGASSPDDDLLDFEKVLRFVNSVKIRSSSSADMFSRFTDILSRTELYDHGLPEMCDEFSDLFEQDSDLYERFKELVQFVAVDDTPRSKEVRTPLTGRPGSNPKRTTSTSSRLRLPDSPDGRNELSVFDEIKELLGPGNSQIYSDFIKCISLLTLEILTKDDVVSVASDLFKNYPAALAAFKDYLEAIGQEGFLGDAGHSSSSLKDLDQETIKQFREKPVSEIAAESTIFGTKSYRMLPRAFPKLICAGRSKLEHLTINDHWVSVTQGSEEYSAKFMRKNSYEDNLYRCEDDRYELDMVIETNAATIMQLEPIALTMKELPSDIKPMHALVEGALNRIHYNAIQRIYGEHGQEIVSQVKLNPSIAIPLVLARLKEKDVHWRRARTEMNRVWRDVGEKNYYRGIDHRSQVFKAFDKKEISSKMLLLDIFDPEQSEENRESEISRARGFILPGGYGIVNDRSRAVQAVTANIKKRPAVPSLELLYKDSTLHKNVFDLIKVAVLKDSGDTAAARSVLRSLRKLVTTFFGASFDEEDAGSTDGPSVLYGDESIYILLRLYDYVYERLALAKTEALKLADSEREKGVMNEKGRARVRGKTHIPDLLTKPTDLVQTFTPTSVHEHFRVGELSQDGQAMYEEFLKMLKGVLLGREDVQKFEDRCRVIIGPMSFVLFTLDKLLTKVARQVSNVCNSESASKAFIDLFQESRVRSKQCEQDSKGLGAGGMESQYCSAVAAHMGKEKGENANVFRMQFVKSGEDKLLSINVVAKTSSDDVDASRGAEAAKLDVLVEFKSASENPEMKRKKPSAGQATSSQELRSVHRGVKRQGGILSAPVLKRGKTFAGHRPVFLQSTVAKGGMGASDVVVANNLRVKMNKVGALVYEPGTSDVFVNKRKKWNRPSTTDVNSKSAAANKVRGLLGIDASGKVPAEDTRMAESTESSSD